MFFSTNDGKGKRKRSELMQNWAKLLWKSERLLFQRGSIYINSPLFLSHLHFSLSDPFIHKNSAQLVLWLIVLPSNSLLPLLVPLISQCPLPPLSLPSPLLPLFPTICALIFRSCALLLSLIANSFSFLSRRWNCSWRGLRRPTVTPSGVSFVWFIVSFRRNLRVNELIPVSHVTVISQEVLELEGVRNVNNIRYSVEHIEVFKVRFSNYVVFCMM